MEANALTWNAASLAPYFPGPVLHRVSIQLTVSAHARINGPNTPNTCARTQTGVHVLDSSATALVKVLPGVVIPAQSERVPRHSHTHGDPTTT